MKSFPPAQEIRLPRLRHDVIPEHTSFTNANRSVGFMSVSPSGISISTGNAKSYLKDNIDVFIKDLEYAIEVSNRLYKHDPQTLKNFHFDSPPSYFHLFRGLLKPMEAPPWKWVDDTDKDYLTLHMIDSRANAGDGSLRHYIALDVHERIVNETLLNVEKIVFRQVERGVTEGVARAVDQQTKTLAKTRAAKADIEKQMAELQKNLDKLTALEAKQEAREQRKAQRKATTRAGYVYILKQIGGTCYKIGRTANPDDRLATFSVKLPFEVQYEHLIQTDDMYALEAELHARYAHCRVGGEFFALTDIELSEIKGSTE